MAAFEVEHEAFQRKLEKSIEEEPARLLTSCDDVTRLCRVGFVCGSYIQRTTVYGLRAFEGAGLARVRALSLRLGHRR